MKAKNIRAAHWGELTDRRISGPVFVLPATLEAYEQMRLQVAREAFCTNDNLWAKMDKKIKEILLISAGGILASIGLTPPATQQPVKREGRK